MRLIWQRDPLTLQTQGILYLDLPIVFAILQANQRHLRVACLSGVVMMSVGLVASSFATSVAHLIVTQGILYGIGGSVSYSTCLILIDEWFDKRKGFAFGIMLVSSLESPIDAGERGGMGTQVLIKPFLTGRHGPWRHHSSHCDRTASHPIRFSDDSSGLERCNIGPVRAVCLLHEATNPTFASTVAEANQHQIHEDAHVFAASAVQHDPGPRLLPAVGVSPQLCQVDRCIT